VATSANYTFTTASPAPVISAVNVSNITTTSVIISWATDQTASSLVQYGTTTAYGSASALNPALVPLHAVTLTGLTPGTAYNFALTSANSAGTVATSANYTFTTASPAPVISAVNVSNITTTSAIISWATDQTATSLVQYGTTTAYGSASALNLALITSHAVTLTGLTPGTTYNFAVLSSNSAGVSTASANFTFATQELLSPPPQISYLAFWGITSSGVTISWSTDVPSTTGVEYGATSDLGSSTPTQALLTNSHGVTLTGLAAGTTYYFQAQSTDANGNIGYSAVYSFTTVGTVAPVITGIVVQPDANNQAQISWITSVPAFSYVQYGSDANYGRWSTYTALIVNPKPALAWVPSGIVHYQLVSIDDLGNQTISPDYTFVEP
jgi:hypothetical protein